MRRLIGIAIFAFQLPLAAQATVKYRMESILTTYADKPVFDRQIAALKAGGIDATAAEKTNGVNANVTTWMIELASKDSAGGTSYLLTMDTSVVQNGAVTLAQRQLMVQSGNPLASSTPRQQVKRTYEIFIKDGKPLTVASNGRSARDLPFPAVRPTMTDLDGLQGLWLLFPIDKWPTAAGTTRADTSINHVDTPSRDVMALNGMTGGADQITMPASMSDDTLYLSWKRSGADTIEVTVNRHSTRKSGPAGPTQTTSRTENTGSYRIILDGGRVVKEAKSSITSQTSSGTSTQPSPAGTNKSMQEFRFVRMP